jgi:uncharacterized HAD superfamily protein/adenine/guanine phosphoribosyltransferase-like PRPP-binding protein
LRAGVLTCLRGDAIHYRSLADLAAAINRSLACIPPDIDLVVGVPRSGMIAATAVAVKLERPLADLWGYAEGRLLRHGNYRSPGTERADHAGRQHILLVDDSIRTGRTLAEACALLTRMQPPPARITTFVAFASEEAAKDVDVVCEHVPAPRLFEWSMLHDPDLARCCVDIDGVLCCDPTAEENDDGPRYLGFLDGARPLMLPSQPIGTLVTARLEKYRRPTEAWLARNGVRYQKLEMLDLPSAEMRLRRGIHGRFKAEVYRRSGRELFIESDPAQAAEIAARSGLPVVCASDGTFVSPGAARAPRQRLRRYLSAGRAAPRKLASLFLERVYSRL